MEESMERADEDDEELGFLFPISLLGLGLGFLYLNRAQTLTLKPVSTAIKLADAAIKGARAVHSPSQQTLILASKALAKGIMITRRRPRNIPNPATRRLRSYVAAANLVRHARRSSLGLGFGTGYKLSKNLARVLEGVVGLQLDSTVRRGIDALGLAAKASAIVREVCRPQRSRSQLGFRRGVRRSGRISLRCERLDFYGNLVGERDVAVVDGEALKVSSPSELLCLAIPLC
ncbi:uncharacterized protein M6B38_337815 [Iris pallida]|uniref:Uncharacterized protein n=1 Tax=Iris pallida TaxID=29817 RepID=A0AAX6GZ34_IRIPA|nr:uncharacterized protein M6B38_337815 [Iris pallida]